MVTGDSRATLTGSGVALPAPVSQQEVWDGYFESRIAHVRGARLAFAASGVTTRHVVANPLVEDLSGWSTAARMQRYEAESLPLGKEALATALDTAGLAAEDVGLLVTVSCTGYSTPGIDIRLAQDFAMAPSLERLQIGHMGCHGAFPALEAASRFVVTTGRPAVVLAVELPSLHVQAPSDEFEQAVVHALFGDAAAAVVLEPASDRNGFDVIDSASLTETASADSMTWRITDRGFRMTLSRSIADIVAPRAAEVVDELLGRNGLGRSDVTSWVIHPGGPRVLDRAGASLGLGEAALALSRSILAENGNCSSATVLMILDRLRHQMPPVGAAVMAIGFGPGLSVMATLLRAR